MTWVNKILCQRCNLLASFADLGICHFCYGDYLKEMIEPSEDDNSKAFIENMTAEEKTKHINRAIQWHNWKKR